MKLATKLTVAFTGLFFVIVSLFGIYMVASAFHTELDNAIYEANDRVTSIMTVLKTGAAQEAQKSDARTNETAAEILQERLLTASGGAYAYSRGSEIRNDQGEKIASSLRRSLTISEDMLLPGDMLMQAIQKNGQERDLIVTGQFSYAGANYTLVNLTEITNIYSARFSYIRDLILFDTIGGAIAAICILMLSRSVTRPLTILAGSVDRIAEGDYSASLPEDCGITEIRTLSHSVKEMESQIASRISELEQKNEEQERFIGSLTHEIRTPLTSIIGYSSLLSMKAEDPAMKSGLSQIHSAGNRIQDLTKSLVGLLTIGKDAPEMKELKLEELLKEAANQYQIKAEQFGAEVTVAGTGSAVTNPGLLSIVVSNFLDNALKAVDGQPERRVNLSCEDRLITIADSGCGIPEEDLEKVFEPFYMVDKSRKHRYGGFGLGLAICAKIRDVLGLEYEITSKVEKGTTICIHMTGPAAPMKADPVSSVHRR